jgi:biopolymer transport protein ExbD
VLGLPAFLAPALGAEVAPSMPVRSTSDFCPPGVSGPSQEGVVIVISKTQILVGDDPNAVVRLPSREQFVQSGLDTAYKANGPSDLFIVPLAAALSHARKEDQAARKAQCLEASTSEAIIVADATTPYRLLSEVLFTLGQTGFGKHHLMVRAGRKRK